MRSAKMIAKTFHGLENVLASELMSLGAKDTAVLKRAVSFYGNKEMLYSCNLNVRTALTVLLPINNFKAKSTDELYHGALNTDWADFFGTDQTFSITNSISSEHFKHSQYASLRVKDAICDHFREQEGRRPSVNSENPDVIINVHIFEDEVTLSLDSSGEPLFKRNYRQGPAPAPLNEVLAAGILKLTGWDPTTQHLIDPMCGSGTFPIEAAMLALDMAPGLLRPRFGFMNWRDFDPRLLARLRRDATARARRELGGGVRIVGADADAAAVDAARRNASFIRANALRFAVRDFFDFEPPPAADALRTLMVLNPPYGHRLQARPGQGGRARADGDGDAADEKGLFKRIGDGLKQRFAGCQAWVLGPVGPGGVAELGLRPSKRLVLFNGALECRLQGYDLYAGRAAAAASPAEAVPAGGGSGDVQ